MKRPMNCKGVLAAAIALFAWAAAPTDAHAQAGDFPTFKGNNQRTGRNGAPVANGSGLTRLYWFAPWGDNNIGQVTVDNTDTTNAWSILDTGGNVNAYFGGFYDYLGGANNLADSLQFGEASSQPAFVPQAPGYNYNNQWIPSNAGETANYAYLLPRRTRIRDGQPIDSTVRSPRYVWTRSTASALGSDPTVAANPADRRYFEWKIGGPAGVARMYALYAWMPVGPTPVPTSVIPAGQIFPQQYFVYEIITSSGLRVVDVVDTYATGGGFARLGNGGKATQALFDYDGVTPIRIRVYNTVPRDEDGVLQIPVTPGTNQRDPARFATFADAARALTSPGTYDASPVIANFGQAETSTIGALNTILTDVDSRGRVSVRKRGVLTSYNHAFTDVTLNNNIRWSFTPLGSANTEVARDNVSPDTAVGPTWTLSLDAAYQNGSAHLSPITNIEANADRVTYAPPLNDGNYDLYVYLPGSQAGSQMGRQVQYVVNEGLVETKLTLDQSSNRGWVRLGNRKFANLSTAQLTVAVTNYSGYANGADTDLGRVAMADGIRFVDSGSLGFNSTPAMANAQVRLDDNSMVARRVVVAPDESGRIWCVDFTGNPAQKTTNVYWCYPSLRRTGFIDPNLTEGIDGPANPAPTDETIPAAEMPTGFDASSALIQNIGGQDYLYIGAKNGRVYCLEVAGRGDYNFATQTPGTTRRVWTYPDDFPASSVTSGLGAIQGSISFAVTAAGPTIFVPTTSGRIIALNALPGNANHTTNVRWVWPDANSPGTGPISGTPAIDNDRVIVSVQARDSEYPRTFALDAATGAQQWVFPTNAQVGTQDRYNTRNWLASPITAPAAIVGGTDTVFAVNQNGYIYALNAATGVDLWSSYEALGGSVASLTLTSMSVYDNTLTVVPNIPVVVVNGADGIMRGFFATGYVNRYGTHRAWQYTLAGESIKASAAAGQAFLYSADTAGYLYAFGNFAGGAVTPGAIGAEEGITENNPLGDIFRGARIGYVNAEAYRRLQLPPTNADSLTFDDLIDRGTMQIKQAYSSTRSPQAFEWGESLYLVMYNFPYLDSSTANAGQPVMPPVANFTFAVEGNVARSIPVPAGQFRNPETAPQNVVDGSFTNSGFSVLRYTFQGGGASALPPGSGTVTASISSQALNGQGASQVIVLDPSLTTSVFTLANPLGIIMPSIPGDPNSGYVNAIGAYEMGLSPNPSAPENLVNGSPNVLGHAGEETRFLTTTGIAQHGLRTTARAFVFDRSMMGVIRPDGLGLDNVRVGLSNLKWQGGESTIYKPLDSTLYPGFEDKPTLNGASIDYPDLRRENVRSVIDRNLNAQNPSFTQGTVSLKAAQVNDGGVMRPVAEGDNLADRIWQVSTLDFDVDVPRYTPANLARLGGAGGFIGTTAGDWDQRYLMLDSNGNTLPQGYLGQVNVFVDSTANGFLDPSSNEAFRRFHLATSIFPDERLSVSTPTVDPSSNQGLVDLGSLAGGTGYDLLPGAYTPWSSDYASIFQPFTVLNEGNVNLLDVRLAKGQNDGVDLLPWGFYGSSNNPLAWLDGRLDLWTNFDSVFAPVYSGVNRQILPKARVGDTVPTAMKVNPTPRANANLPGTWGALNGTLPPDNDPKVSVTIPLGFPVGAYSSTMAVIENATSNEFKDRVLGGWESTADPTFELKFNVRESRLTTRQTKNTAAMIDNYALVPAGDTQPFRNLQPGAMRDPNGSLLIAWSSGRPDQATSRTNQPPTDDPFRIYLASVDNASSYSDAVVQPPTSGAVSPLRNLTTGNAGNTPLRDLSFFVPGSNAAWFKPAAGTAAGYPLPAQVNPALFGTNDLLPGTAKFYAPTFPVAGRFNPIVPSNIGAAYPNVLMAFVGEAATSAGPVSRLFVTQVAMDANGTVTNIGAPVPLTGDEKSRKGKPAIVQTGPNSGMVFFPVVSANATTIYYSRYENGVFANYVPVPFGSGFDSITNLSAVVRMYRNTRPVVEVTFTGRLRGESQFQVFRGRMATNAAASGVRLMETPTGSLDQSVWSAAQAITEDPLTLSGSGRYLAPGVRWDLNQPIDISMRIGTGAAASVLVPNTRTVDNQTGIISHETTLGGRVFLDPATGTVRFTNSAPARNATLLVSYAPWFSRVNDAAANYGEAQLTFDGHKVSDALYWVPGNMANNALRNDRMVYMYSRSGGDGQATRPQMKTYRVGVQLPAPILTNDAGAVVGLNVTGNTGPYEVDPAAGRIFFTAADEDRAINVAYTPVEAGSGNALPTANVAATARMIPEAYEFAIPIEQAVNEINATLFLDPFDPVTADLRLRRPSLFWMLWTSTRAGQSDVYLQGYSPRFSSVPLGN